VIAVLAGNWLTCSGERRGGYDIRLKKEIEMGDLVVF
jgi:hypothetical protein